MNMAPGVNLTERGRGKRGQELDVKKSEKTMTRKEYDAMVEQQRDGKGQGPASQEQKESVDLATIESRAAMDMAEASFNLAAKEGATMPTGPLSGRSTGATPPRRRLKLGRCSRCRRPPC